MLKKHDGQDINRDCDLILNNVSVDLISDDLLCSKLIICKVLNKIIVWNITKFNKYMKIR